MRKIISLFVAALFCATMFAATETTVYYTAPAATIGTYTVKLNVHYGCNANDAWEQFTMTKTEQMYNNDPVYSASFTDKWDGLCTMQFQLYDGDTHKSEVAAFNGAWTGAVAYNGKMYVHETGKWVTLSGEETLPSILMHGNFTGGWKDTEEFTASEDKKTASLKMTIGVGNYEFGMKVDGSWIANGAAFTREDNSKVVNTGSGNLTLAANPAGDYTFTWTFETNTLTVTYPQGELQELPKFYITGDSALVVDAGLAADKAWTPDAIKSEKDTFVLNLKADQYYRLKLSLNGTWGDGQVKGYTDLTEQTAGLIDDSNDHNIGFKLTEAGEVKVIYTAETFRLEGKFASDEPVVVTVEDGFYLVGSAIGWEAKADYKFAQNPENDAEYLLNDVTLAEGDGIKVVGYVSGNATWYPDGEGTEYKVDAAHAGLKTIYFQPAGNTDWAAFGGFIYIQANEDTPEGIVNTAVGAKAVKVLRNGILLIEKAGVRYNVMGQAVQ